MNIRDKLVVFNEMAMQDAEKKCEQLMNEIENKYLKAVRDISRNAQKIADEKYRQACAEAERLKNKEIIQASSDARRSLIDLRKQYMDELFQSVEKRLEEFTLSPEYEAYLVREISRHVSIGRATVYLDERDMGFAEKITQKTGWAVEVSPENLHGGFRLLFEEKRAVVDFSFKSRLEEIRKNRSFFSIGAVAL